MKADQLLKVKLFHPSKAHSHNPCHASPTSRDVTEPAKIHIHRMQTLCAKSVRCRCGFVARSKLIPAVIATAIQLSVSSLKLDSYKQTSSE